MSTWRTPSIGTEIIYATARHQAGPAQSSINAVKFTPPGSKVTVLPLVCGWRHVAWGQRYRRRHRARIGKVFDSFGQGKHDVAVADKGTGLLAIVKAWWAHGGQVRLEARWGKAPRYRASARRPCAAAATATNWPIS
jgi:hypothetical protein